MPYMAPVDLQASIQACMVYLIMSVIANTAESDRIGSEILVAVHVSGPCIPIYILLTQ